MVKKKTKKFCPKCGNSILAGEKYCSGCGRKIYEKGKRREKGPNWVWIGGIVITGAILVTVVVLGIGPNKKESINRAHNTAQISSIVSEFDCSCGQCEKTLSNCDCPTAKETYAYISKAVGKEKYSHKEIIEMVKQRYGHFRGD